MTAPELSGWAPPTVVFRGARWSSDELRDRALAWRDALADTLGDATAPTAMVMPNHPEAVALFWALSCFPAPVIVLPPEPREWRSTPPIAPGTRLFLSSAARELAPQGTATGFEVTVLSEPAAPGHAAGPSLMTAPGVVLFTSGSTGAPKPVYRSTQALLAAGAALATAVGVPAGQGVIGALPLARGYGMIHALMHATARDAPLGLLEHFDWSAMLELFASEKYHYWAGTAVMAEVLSRCPLPGRHPAPPIGILASRLSPSTCRAFKARFGVPLRQTYGTTESGPVTLDTRPAGAVQSQTVGLPLPGAHVRIGDPAAPVPHGEPGRIWVSTPWPMEAYGIPPRLEPRPTVDGWWPSPDVGHLDDAGCLTLDGRLDECVRTRAGHVVHPAMIAGALESHPDVRDVVVVPLETPTGPVLGVLVEGTRSLNEGDLQAHLARTLPAWSRPSVLRTTQALPRVSAGKTDRKRCIELLAGSLRGEDHA